MHSALSPKPDIGPHRFSQCPLRDAPAVLRIFSHKRKTFFHTIRQKRTHPSTRPLVSNKSDKARIDYIDGDHTIALKAERQRREVVIPK
jgi:hypothetical protein